MRNVLERLLNLLAYLLTVRRPVTAEEIRRTVAGYAQESDEAFHRMFERDKEVLRRIGVPLELRATDRWEIETGYRVDPNRYRLPDPGLTEEERAALWLAAQAIRLGGRPAGPEAILKLGGARMAGAVEPLAAELGAGPDLLGELLSAVTQRQRVRFTYRGQRRRLAPYGLGHRRGHWYLAGKIKEGIRQYRVDRMEEVEIEEQTESFARPKGFRMRELLDTEPWETGTETPLRARVWFAPDLAWWAARQVDELERHADGSVVATLEVSNQEAFIGWVLNFGASAEVLEPQTLRRALVDRVRGVA